MHELFRIRLIKTTDNQAEKSTIVSLYYNFYILQRSITYVKRLTKGCIGKLTEVEIHIY